MALNSFEKNSGSFRDPSGFVFYENGCIYRQINNSYKENFDLFMSSRLYENLVDNNLIIPHEEQRIGFFSNQDIYKVIKPEIVPFISYPYEWCFSQLKNAALTTLKIQKTSLSLGMSLKDASAYNIQFINGNPLLIDTLSFEKYSEGAPWIAYKQFCQHFLAPLALMSLKDLRLGQLSKIFLDGTPLPLASSLLPERSWLNFGLLVHLHLHSRYQKGSPRKGLPLKHNSFSKNSFLGLIDSLEKVVGSLNIGRKKSIWANYYAQTNYSNESFSFKKEIVSRFLAKINTGVVWDFGANVGIFSEIACRKGAVTVSFDSDPLAVERNYLQAHEKKLVNYLPLVMDISNPSGGLGWDTRERFSLENRGTADALLALALVHHLAISNNIPLIKIAAFFRKLCKSLIIEFVSKKDSQVKGLLSLRKDIFNDYDQEKFENAFKKYFTIQNKEKIPDTERTIYLMG